jgi:AAA15 family ATPase/GTPase
LGRFNVLIGANGCGKSNILEAIAMASASAAGKLDFEFFANRGIRVSEPRMMFPAFNGLNEDIMKITVSCAKDDKMLFSLKYNSESKPPRWEDDSINFHDLINEIYKQVGKDVPTVKDVLYALDDIRKDDDTIVNLRIKNIDGKQMLMPVNINFERFIIYSLEESELRKSYDNNRIFPLGRHGEGLFAYLKQLTQQSNGKNIIKEINENLDVLDWFDKLDVPSDQLSNEFRVSLNDTYIDKSISVFDQSSANEGFLYLLFYLTLIISDETPRFLAIENIDASFNPKLCREVIRRLIALARKHNKQIIATTHNPAVLDGLNLEEEDVVLSVVRRTVDGYTKTNKVTLKGKLDIPLSEAWMRGYIGGLPDNF